MTVNVLGVASVIGENVLASFTSKKRSIGGFVAQVTVREDHSDDLTVTNHPVERGAAISDHAFKNPARLSLVVGWSNSSTAAAGAAISSGSAALATGGLAGAATAALRSDYVRTIYAKFLALQASREPFSVSTGKRKYDNMLITSLATTTNGETENSLILEIGLREIIIVQTQTTTVPPRENQAAPEQTADTANAGTKQAVPATSANGKSILQILTGP